MPLMITSRGQKLHNSPASIILIPNQLMTDELIWKKPRALRVGRDIALLCFIARGLKAKELNPEASAFRDG